MSPPRGTFPSHLAGHCSDVICPGDVCHGENSHDSLHGCAHGAASHISQLSQYHHLLQRGKLECESEFEDSQTLDDFNAPAAAVVSMAAMTPAPWVVPARAPFSPSRVCFTSNVYWASPAAWIKPPSFCTGLCAGVQVAGEHMHASQETGPAAARASQS